MRGGEFEEVGEESGAEGRCDGLAIWSRQSQLQRHLQLRTHLWMELNTPQRLGAVPQRHDVLLPLVHRPPNRLQLRGQRAGLYNQAVELHRSKDLRHAGEQLVLGVSDLGDLAMDRRRSLDDLRSSISSPPLLSTIERLTSPPNAVASPWCPKHTPQIGSTSPNSRMRRFGHEKSAALCGEPGPGPRMTQEM